MKNELQNMFELVDLLNELSLDNQDNPVATSEYWPFVFSTDGENFGEILLNSNRVVETRLPTYNTIAHNFDPPMSKMEMLREIQELLKLWSSALTSAMWVVNQAIERLK